MMFYRKLLATFHRHCLLRSVRCRLRSAEREVRAETVLELIRLGDTRGLCHALRTPDRWVRTQALKGLTEIAGVKAVSQLVRTLTDEPEVARVAAECLAHLDGPRVVRALRRCVASEDWLVRFYGTRGLARNGSSSVVPLLQRLQDDDHPWVKEEAANALKRLARYTTGQSTARDRKGGKG